MMKNTKIRNSIVAATVLCLGQSLSGQGYVELITEAAANSALGGDAFGNAFYDTAAVDGSTVYSFVREVGSGASGAAIVAYDTVTSTYSVVSTPAQMAAQRIGTRAPVVVYGFTPINGGTALRFLDSASDALYETDVASGDTSLVSIPFPFGNRYSANTVFRADGSGFAYDSTDDRIMSISPAGVFTELLNSAQLTVITGNDLVNGSLGIWNDTLYIGSSSTDDLFFYDLGDSSTGTVFTGNLIDTTSDDPDGRVGFGDIFTAPDGLIYFYETDSDAIFSFDPNNPDGTLQVVFDESSLNGGPGSDRVGEMAWLDGELAWTGGGDGFYVVPEPSAYAMIAGFLVLGATVFRRRR